MVGQIYPTKLQLNKANSSNTEDPFLDMDWSTTNGIVSPMVYIKRDNFNFEIINFPFLIEMFLVPLLLVVNISQLIRFVSSTT